MYSRFEIFFNDMVEIDMQKSQLILNKPVYIRMTILDNRNIFYNELEKIIRPQYGELLYRDTGSLLSETRTDDVYKDNQSNQNLYDTSHYPKEHPPYSNANKKKTNVPEPAR